MEKNWLIRTVQKQILGPVSKEKVIEFVEKGALKKEDQICSGNGFWFRIEEKDLLEQYLFGDETQPFNPVSEAQTTFGDDDLEVEGQTAQTQIIDLNAIKLEQPAALPQQDDLEYPDSNGDPEKVAPKNVKYPSSDDLEYPDSIGMKPKTGCNDLELTQEEDLSLELENKKDN